MDADDLKKRTKDFAHRCVKLALSLSKSPLDNHIKGQLIKCSTSVAANYRSACVAQSKPDFISKLSIAIEEADEACFWMEFIIDEQLLKKQRVLSLLQERVELTSIFLSSRKTARGVAKKLQCCSVSNSQ